MISIDRLEPVHIGDDIQWVLLRGADTRKPVVLFLQQGPGLPTIHEARAIQTNLGLEYDYVVAYWDRRSCGKSYNPNADLSTATFEQLLDDVGEMLQWLTQRFKCERVHLLGLSMGGTLVLRAAAHWPETIASVLAVGPDINWKLSEQFGLDMAYRRASQRGDSNVLRKLSALGNPPYLQASQFEARAMMLLNYHGVHTGHTYGSMLREFAGRVLTTPQYSLLQRLRAFQAMKQVTQALLPSLSQIDLMRTISRIEVPVTIAQGRHDLVAPPALAQQFFDILEAPQGKRLMFFENSAHIIYDEEPALFGQVVRSAFADTAKHVVLRHIEARQLSC